MKNSSEISVSNQEHQQVAGNAGTKVYDSSSLFGTEKELVIQHAGRVYRLRITRQNKLILTK